MRKEWESVNGGRLEVKEVGCDVVCIKIDIELRCGYVYRKLVLVIFCKFN